MSTFWLKVIASDHTFYNGNCEMLVVPAHDGEFGILPHMEAMILAIREGVLKFRIPGSKEIEEAVVGTGIVQVANNRVTVVTDTAERPEDIDRIRLSRLWKEPGSSCARNRALRNTKCLRRPWRGP